MIQHARRADLLVITDGKRNDIGSTATAYADAYLGAESPWGSDSLTVSPYLGRDSLEPFVEVCDARAGRHLCPRQNIQSRWWSVAGPQDRRTNGVRGSRRVAHRAQPGPPWPIGLRSDRRCRRGNLSRATCRAEASDADQLDPDSGLRCPRWCRGRCDGGGWTTADLVPSSTTPAI